jgi:hypothetical protein
MAEEQKLIILFYTSKIRLIGLFDLKIRCFKPKIRQSGNAAKNDFYIHKIGASIRICYLEDKAWS